MSDGKGKSVEMVLDKRAIGAMHPDNPITLVFGMTPKPCKGPQCVVGIVGGELPILVEYVADNVALQANMFPAYARHLAALFIEAADKCDELQEQREQAKAKERQLKLI